MYTDTKKISYRQELDILENLESALYDCADLEAVAWEIADQWPSDAYNLRVIQWLQAGSPDLDDTSVSDCYNTAAELVAPQHRGSLTQSLHDMIGTVLHGIAHDYISDVIDVNDDTPVEALDKVRAAIAEHRADLMQHDGHALTPPYQFSIYNGHQATYTIHVTN